MHNSITNSTEFNSLPINTGENCQYFCYNVILQKLYDMLSFMTNKHCRVLFIRFDIRFPHGYSSDGSNNAISHLCKIMKENSISRGIDISILWVREQSREKHQHYHAIALIDGAKVQNYQSFLYEVARVWGYVLGCDASGLIDWCSRDRQGMSAENGIMIERPRMNAQGMELVTQQAQYQANLNRCFEWGSYLAKTNQKANTPPGVRRYGASQIK